jgi:hypothetical protein
MVVLVLLIVGLAIERWHVLSSLWPLLTAVTVGYGVCRWLAPLRPAPRPRDACDRLRHERARQEIDRIALQTRRGMYDAALRHGDVIEGTAIEVKDR